MCSGIGLQSMNRAIFFMLQLMPSMEGTSGEICTIIANTPAYVPQLDMAIVSGKKTLPRWVGGHSEG